MNLKKMESSQVMKGVGACPVGNGLSDKTLEVLLKSQPRHRQLRHTYIRFSSF